MKRFIFVAVQVVVLGALAVASPRARSQEGFTPLFDGKTLDGWQGGKDGYLVQDNVLGL